MLLFLGPKKKEHAGAVCTNGSSISFCC